jgi:putative tRNA adenosine deaminase-associated protein
VSYFAAALARTDDGWSGVELDLSEVEDLEALTDLLRDLTGEGPGPALMLLEEDDEHVAVVRVDGGVGSLDEARVFLSDRRAVQGSEVAAMLWEQAEPDEDEEEDDDDEAASPLAEQVGDTGLLADLGTPADLLLETCAGEGLLPADVLTTLCERAGCLDALEQLREG